MLKKGRRYIVLAGSEDHNVTWCVPIYPYTSLPPFNPYGPSKGRISVKPGEVVTFVQTTDGLIIFERGDKQLAWNANFSHYFVEAEEMLATSYGIA